MRGTRRAGQFGIDFDYDVGRTVLTLHGELDALSVPAFAGVLHALADRGVESVTIDLSDLRFCNIGGLRAMAELAARVHPVDGSVEILAPGILMRMLGIAELQSLFVLDPTPRRRAPDDDAMDDAAMHDAAMHDAAMHDDAMHDAAMHDDAIDIADDLAVELAQLSRRS